MPRSRRASRQGAGDLAVRQFARCPAGHCVAMSREGRFQRPASHGRYPAVGIAPVSARARDGVCSWLVFVGAAPRHLPPCRPMLAKLRQAKRSGTANAFLTLSMRWRRRAGLDSFADADPRVPRRSSGRSDHWRDHTSRPIDRTASATDRPCDASTSTCRSFATICSGLCLF